MDLSAGRGRLTQQERQRRRQLNLCLYCGEGGHMIRNCPTIPRIAAVEEGNQGENVDDPPEPQIQPLNFRHME